MSNRWHCLKCLLLPLALLVGGGCLGANNRTVRIAQQAEENGEAHIAYDAYCQAARQDPGDARVSSSLKRLAPTAAAYWDSQARIAESKGQYGDAWRMGVKSLDIRPDQPGMADFVRNIETDHPDAVASARREWEQSGRVRVAAAPRAVKSQPEPQLASAAEPRMASAAEPQLASAARAPEPAEVTVEPAPEEMVIEAAPVEETQAEVTDEPPPQRPPARSNDAYAAAAPPRTYSAPRPGSNRRRTPRIYSAPRGPRPALAADGNTPASEYMVMYTLSREEERFPERQKLADGIFMRLRDVDDDRTADIDLDDGDERVQKIRGLREGQSKLFRGRSGGWYRFTLIDVQERGETIRVGIRPG